MRGRLTCAVAAVACVTGVPAHAQKRIVVPRPRPVVTPARVDSVAPAAKPRQRTPAPTDRHVSVSSYVLTRLDDNVNRDETQVTSVGMATGLTGRWESDATRPGATLEYDVALHRYSATDRYDRVSQRLRATLSRRTRRWWTLDLVTEGSLRGSSEDRDVSDQFTLQPRSEFRLGDDTRLRLVGTQRWRRYPTDSLQDAANRYAVLEVRRRLPAGVSLEASGRVERNAARGARFDYRRTTLAAVATAPLGRRLVATLELQHRQQVYPGRPVDVGSRVVARRDRRWQPAATLEARLAGLELTLGAEPEWRRSNDPDKAFDEHVLVFGMRRRW